MQAARHGRRARDVEPGQEDRHEVVAIRRGRIVERGVQRVGNGRQLRRLVVLGELRVVLGLLAIPVVLLCSRDHDFVDQRVPQARDLDPRTRRGDRAVGVEGADLLPARRRPDAEDGVGVVRTGGGRVVLGQAAKRDVERDGVRVEPTDAVDAGIGRQGQRVERVERAEPAQIEDRAEVDEERIVPLAGEDLRPVGEAVDGLCSRRIVVRRGARPDVHRRRPERTGQAGLGVAVPVDGVDLPLEEVPVGEARDRSVVVEEGRDPGEVRRRGARLESEVVVDVGDAVTGVVDVDRVEDARVEREEVRPARRLLQRDVVRDDRQSRGVGRVEEGVEVRVVGGGIAGDQRCLSMAGGEDRPDRRRRDQRGAGQGDCLRTSGHDKVLQCKGWGKDPRPLGI